MSEQEPMRTLSIYSDLVSPGFVSGVLFMHHIEEAVYSVSRCRKANVELQLTGQRQGPQRQMASCFDARLHYTNGTCYRILVRDRGYNLSGSKYLRVRQEARR
jgi:hypothetical protein